MVSVIVPMFNEELLVLRFLDKLFSELKETGNQFEVICVDDGSYDSTLQKLLEFRSRNSSLKIVSLSRNFGLQNAITAGLDYASGTLTVIMDGDFQDPPELLPELIKKINSTGADIVTAVREKRFEKFPKNILIKLFHKVFNKLSDDNQIYQTGNFSIINSKAKCAIQKFTERNRYIPGIRNFIGFYHEFIYYNRPERFEGQAKMKMRNLISLASDAIYSFTKWPLKFCLFTGFTGVSLFTIAIAYTLLSKFTGFAPIGWSSIFLAICFFGSVQLLFLGILGEYLYRIFKEVQGRPLYLVKEVYD